MDTLNLTELETKFIGSLTSLLFAEPGFTDVEIKEIAERMNIEINIAKGVLGSLTKKGVVLTDRVTHEEWKKVGRKIKPVTVKYELIILHPDFYYLHPRWIQVA